MRYKIIDGSELIKEVLERMKRDILVTSSYFGKTVSNICNTCNELNGIVYEPKKRELTIVGDKNNSLIKKFYETINQREIRLEPI